MTKGPTLLCIDSRAGTICRYVRTFNTYVAGMGWYAHCLGELAMPPGTALGDNTAALDYYRKTGTLAWLPERG
jgi:hypothetical protein